MSTTLHKLFDTKDLDDLVKTFDVSESEVKKAIAETLNETALEIEDEARKIVEQETNLTRAYINGKLGVKTRAKANSLQAVICSNVRPVLLARFDARQEYKPGKTKARVNGGVSVQVKSIGGRKHMASAFFIPLKRGKSSGTGARGLAVRPGKSGMSLSPSAQKEVNKRGFAVLHGPSVDQVFRSHLERLTPTADDMFTRLLRKLENGNNS